MSGVSTRSHRSSVRGAEATLAELSDLLKANKSIVMITGAGLSAASGERMFASWEVSLEAWPTAAAHARGLLCRIDAPCFRDCESPRSAHNKSRVVNRHSFARQMYVKSNRLRTLETSRDERSTPGMHPTQQQGAAGKQPPATRGCCELLAG